MTLIKEDFYPKKPGRQSALSALPAFATTAFVAFAPWFGAVEPAMAMVTLEFPLLILLVIAGAASGSGSRFVKWFGLAWVFVILTAATASIAYATGEWSYLLGVAGATFAHGATFVRRDRWLQRDLLMARGGIGLLVAWALLFASAFPILLVWGQDPPEAAWVSVVGALLFGFFALLDLFRILVPPSADAGPHWWRWDGRAPTGRP